MEELEKSKEISSGSGLIPQFNPQIKEDRGEELIKHWLCGMEPTCRRGACFFCNLKNPHLEWFQNVDL